MCLGCVMMLPLLLIGINNESIWREEYDFLNNIVFVSSYLIVLRDISELIVSRLKAYKKQGTTFWSAHLWLMMYYFSSYSLWYNLLRKKPNNTYNMLNVTDRKIHNYSQENLFLKDEHVLQLKWVHRLCVWKCVAVRILSGCLDYVRS